VSEREKDRERERERLRHGEGRCAREREGERVYERERERGRGGAVPIGGALAAPDCAEEQPVLGDAFWVSDFRFRVWVCGFWVLGFG